MKQLTIFDKLVEKPGALISQQIEAANAQKIKLATEKVEKRATRKKGKFAKYTVESNLHEEDEPPSNTATKPAAVLEDSKKSDVSKSLKEATPTKKETTANNNIASSYASTSSLHDVKSASKHPVVPLVKTQSEVQSKKKVK